MKSQFIHNQNKRKPAASPEIWPKKLMPGKKDQIIPMPVRREIDFDNFELLFISHSINKKLFLPKIVVIKIKASTPNKIPLNPIARDIGFP